MLSKPLLSIVVPNYNYGAYLKELLDGINSIDSRELVEVIVVDANSSDNSFEIITSTLISSDQYLVEPDEGQADAVNKGLRLAKGEWFIFQNSDDLFDFEALEKFLRNINYYVSYDIVAYNQGFLTSVDGTFFERKISFVHSGVFFIPLFLLNIYFTNQSTFYRRSKAVSIGFNKNFKFCLDLDFTVRFFKKFNPKIYYVNEVIGFQRLHPSSKTSTIQDQCVKEARLIRKKEFSFVDYFLLFPSVVIYYSFRFLRRVFVTER